MLCIHLCQWRMMWWGRWALQVSLPRSFSLLTSLCSLLPPSQIWRSDGDRCLTFNYKKIVSCNKQTFSKYFDEYSFWYSKKICVSVSSCLFRKISILSYEKQNQFSEFVYVYRDYNIAAYMWFWLIGFFIRNLLFPFSIGWLYHIRFWLIRCFFIRKWLIAFR